jgi:hypothetical protein
MTTDFCIIIINKQEQQQTDQQQRDATTRRRDDATMFMRSHDIAVRNTGCSLRHRNNKNNKNNDTIDRCNMKRCIDAAKRDVPSCGGGGRERGHKKEYDVVIFDVKICFARSR